MTHQVSGLLALSLTVLMLQLIPHSLIAQTINKTGQDQKSPFGNWENKRQILQICGGILADSDAIKELEIVDDQRRAITSAYENFRSRIRDCAPEFKRRILQLSRSDLSEAERIHLESKILAERDEKVKSDAEPVFKQLQEILLPQQLERLRQLIYQRLLLAKSGHDRTKTFLYLADDLELSKKELSQFKKDAATIGENFNEQLVKLQQKHDQEMLNALPAAASKRAKKLMGKLYLNY
jgi:hypothetical protein